MGTWDDLASTFEKLLPVVRPLVEPRPGGDPAAFPRTQVHDALLGKKGVLADNAALGALIAAGIEVGQAIYRKPGLQASLDALVREVVGQNPEAGEAPEEVALHARQVASLFRSLGLHPSRLAVDGLPGSGKSSLARALAQTLGLRWQSLDHFDLDTPMPLDEEGVVYEHHRLLRTQDVDRFDALLYLDEPVEVSKAKILRRRRGGYLVDVMDFDRLKRIGERAFACAQAPEYALKGSCIRLKVKPPEGFRSLDALKDQARESGIDPEALSKEELLFLATEHRARKGFRAYLDAGAYNREVMTGVAAGLFHLGRHLAK